MCGGKKKVFPKVFPTWVFFIVKQDFELKYRLVGFSLI
jgi:hypothetical protein